MEIIEMRYVLPAAACCALSLPVFSVIDPVPQPDTFMVLFDASGNVIAQDDNSSTLGDGWASGMHGVGIGSGFIDNGDGTHSLRIGITGRPDGLDGVFNGLFQNGHHGQNGPFMLSIQCYEPFFQPTELITVMGDLNYGAEAVVYNIDVPAGTFNVDIDIKNDFPFPCTPPDLNMDSVIDTADLGILISAFGETPDPAPAPDVVMYLQNQQKDTIVSDDNSSTLGDGSAPGLTGIGLGSGIVDAGSGFVSIRAFITGAGDNDDGQLDGLVSGAPHGELGRITVFADCFDINGTPIGSYSRSVEFVTGAEAHHVNFEVPIGTVTANVQVDNTVGGWPLPADINEDGVVDTADLGALIGVFGDICTP